MAVATPVSSAPFRPIPSSRWWIGAIFFASTVINYIDRQTLSILAPYLKQDYHWTNVDYANIAIAFLLAYSLGQTVCGRLMDKVGTRRGLTISITWYSNCFCLDVAGERLIELHDISISAGSGRIRELARSE